MKLAFYHKDNCGDYEESPKEKFKNLETKLKMIK
jgi:hypothetical protein